MAKRCNEEDRITRTIADYLRLAGKPGMIWYHVPNGGARNAITGANLKAMGVRPGVADFHLLFAKDGSLASHYVEVKTSTGRQSKSQKDFERDVLAIDDDLEHGESAYHIVRSLDEAVALFRSIGAVACHNR